MDVVDLVEDVAQQVAVEHAVDRALENGADDVAAVAAVGAGERAQVGEQAGAFPAVGQWGVLLLVEEGDEGVAGDAVGFGRPVTPAVGRLEGGAVAFAGESGLGFADLILVVEEFEEQNPSEHGQPV